MEQVMKTEMIQGWGKGYKEKYYEELWDAKSCETAGKAYLIV